MVLSVPIFLDLLLTYFCRSGWLELVFIQIRGQFVQQKSPGLYNGCGISLSDVLTMHRPVTDGYNLACRVRYIFR